MLRQTIVSILLASSVTIFTACGGSSKSTDTQTTPVAAAPAEETPAPATPTPTPTPEETGIPGAERQNVSGVQPATPPAGTPGTSMDNTGTPSSMDTTGSTGTTEAKPDTAKPDVALAPITEANIFAILGAANEHEIAVSNLALKTSKNKDVKKFAKMMVTEHGKMNKAGSALAKKLTITPEPNDDVSKLKMDSTAALDKLGGLKGAEFDQAFAAQMVQDHDNVLSLIETRIKPAATNADLQKMLETDRPKIEHHLDEAKNLQGKLAAK